jgi:type VI secretion system protein VasJ
MAKLTQIVNDCLTPLSDGGPEGIDAKYEPEYMAAQEEIAKITVGDGTDWKIVADSCTTLLTQKTKDINIAGYLCLAWFKTKGYDGLDQGLEIYLGLLSSFDYYPKKMSEAKTHKMRSASIEWLNLRVSEFIDAFPPQQGNDSPESIVQGFDRLLQIEGVVQETFDPAPSLFRLIEVLGRYRERALKHVKSEENEQAPEEGRSSPDSDKESTSGSKPAEKKDSSEIRENADSDPVHTRNRNVQTADTQAVPNDLENPSGTLMTVAGVLRENDPADPMAYRIMRVVKWENLKNAPPSDNDGKTRIPAPRPEMMGAVKKSFAAQDPLVTIRICENAFSGYGLWWLDLQYNMVMAMERAGQQFIRAKEGVQSELASLTARFPKIIELKFSDGTPFADEKTQVYVRELNASVKGRGAEIETSIPSDDLLGKTLNQAKKMASESDLDGALTFLQRGINESSGQRNRFYCRLQAGAMCLKYGRIYEALVILEDLYERSSGIHLRDWDPKFYFSLCMTLERVYRKNGKAVSPEKQKMIHEQVLRQNLGYQLAVT